MADTDWRAAGERYMAQAQDAANRGDDPKLCALVAIYCEMRRAADEQGAHGQTMDKLAGALYEHADALHRNPQPDV